MAEDLISDLLGDDLETAPTEDRVTSPERVEGDGDETSIVYGDNAYGTGDFHSRLEDEGVDSRCKTQKPNATNGLFSKERFRRA